MSGVYLIVELIVVRVYLIVDLIVVRCIFIVELNVVAGLRERARCQDDELVTSVSPGPRHGQQAQLLLCTAHPEGLPLRGLAVADIEEAGRPLAQVRTTSDTTHITM